jgi:hypothetical protein
MPVKTERLLTLSEDINSSTKEFTNPVDAVGVIPASFCRNFRATCIAASDTLSSAKKIIKSCEKWYKEYHSLADKFDSGTAGGNNGIPLANLSSIAVPLAEIMEYR